MSNLPSEIWLNILRSLHKNDIKDVSLVSRYLHEAAISILFNSVELWFGCFPIRSEQYGLQDVSADPSMEERQTQRSLQILLRIAQDTAFAQSITHLRVIALVDHAMVFERCTRPYISRRTLLTRNSDHLQNAILVMHKLRRFEWIGEPIYQDIAKELSTNYPEMDSLYITQ